MLVDQVGQFLLVSDSLNLFLTCPRFGSSACVSDEENKKMKLYSLKLCAKLVDFGFVFSGTRSEFLHSGIGPEVQMRN